MSKNHVPEPAVRLETAITSINKPRIAPRQVVTVFLMAAVAVGSVPRQASAGPHDTILTLEFRDCLPDDRRRGLCGHGEDRVRSDFDVSGSDTLTVDFGGPCDSPRLDGSGTMEAWTWVSLLGPRSVFNEQEERQLWLDPSDCLPELGPCDDLPPPAHATSVIRVLETKYEWDEVAERWNPLAEPHVTEAMEVRTSAWVNLWVQPWLFEPAILGRRGEITERCPGSTPVKITRVTDSTWRVEAGPDAIACRVFADRAHSRMPLMFTARKDFDADPPDDRVDTDGDGLTDEEEEDIFGTYPDNPDSDGDGIWDEDEILDDLGDPMDADSDDDGLNDLEESEAGTDPYDADSDGDGLSDGDEVRNDSSDPLDLDTDDDGLEDGREVNLEGTDPTACDSDADGLPDGLELGVTEPVADPDDYGLLEGTDIDAECGSVLAFISDNDPEGTTSPLDADTDGDGCLDGAEDIDTDGAIGARETDPREPLDCSLLPRGRLVVLRLSSPLADLRAVFDGAPCTTSSDLRFCAEAPGVREVTDAPELPVIVGAAGHLVLIELDSDLDVDGSPNLIVVRSDPSGLRVEPR